MSPTQDLKGGRSHRPDTTDICSCVTNKTNHFFSGYQFSWCTPEQSGVVSIATMAILTVAINFVFPFFCRPAWCSISGVGLGIDYVGVYPDAVGDSSCPKGYVGNSHCCPTAYPIDHFNEDLCTTFCCADECRQSLVCPRTL
jgi:hypothetical protein